MPAMEGRGPKTFPMRLQNDAECVIGLLESEFGEGVLENPQGLRVLPHPKHKLGPGEHLYILVGPGRNPQRQPANSSPRLSRPAKALVGWQVSFTLTVLACRTMQQHESTVHIANATGWSLYASICRFCVAHMRHAGRIPDLHLYVGKPGQGLKARDYHTQRKAAVNAVLETAMVSAAQRCAASSVNVGSVLKV